MRINLEPDVAQTMRAALKTLEGESWFLDEAQGDVARHDIAKARAALDSAQGQGGWQPVADGEYSMGPDFAPLRISHNNDATTNTWVEYAGNEAMLDVGMAMCRWEGAGRPKIVCLCGSTRFYEAFVEANFRETMAGNIMLSVGFFMHRPEMIPIHGETVGITPDEKVMLDALHMRKVEMADEVLVLNVNGYVGESTGRELAYARQLGKVVRFLEPEQRQRPAGAQEGNDNE